MGAVLAAHSRDVDAAARFGGDEFVVLLPGSDRADADAFTRRIRLALAAGDASGLPAVCVSAGVAVAVAPRNVEALLHGADSALYAAKHAGRDRTVIFEREDSSLLTGPTTELASSAPW
jgi:diguanylate cyclase (GGDEF)-like protein